MVPYSEGDHQFICFTRLVTDGDNGIDLSAGAHTVKLQWKRDTTGGLQLTLDVAASLVVEEV